MGKQAGMIYFIVILLLIHNLQHLCASRPKENSFLECWSQRSDHVADVSRAGYGPACQNSCQLSKILLCSDKKERRLYKASTRKPFIGRHELLLSP